MNQNGSYDHWNDEIVRHIKIKKKIGNILVTLESRIMERERYLSELTLPLSDGKRVVLFQATQKWTEGVGEEPGDI